VDQTKILLNSISLAKKLNNLRTLNIFSYNLIITSEHVRVYLNVSHLVKNFFELLILPYTYIVRPARMRSSVPLLEPGPPRFFWWYENNE
jgi:hypothetical protein